MKILPIGISTYRTMIEDNFVYVDKTVDAHKLIQQGRYYFLSRPRRFGKSLFLDTLSEVFKGSKELFKGLYIYDKWDWNDTYPVIKISFGSGSFNDSGSVYRRIGRVIKENCKKLSITLEIEMAHVDVLLDLIELVYERYNKKVVILIDEYDKPILDVITDKKQASIHRDILKNFYSAIKDCDEYIRFVFITGVSKFSKMNLFSGLNNLNDITVNADYATITGYTQDDLTTYFSDYLHDVDHQKMKKWYNGYNYFGTPVYNPFDILLFISNNCEYKNYWWTTGNTSSLIDILKKEKYYIPQLENIVVSEETLDTFDVENVDLVALLWQTGYLTFDKKIEVFDRINYQMKMPNFEIVNSLNSLFFNYLTDLESIKGQEEVNMAVALKEGDVNKIHSVLSSLFASIPYNNYAKNIIAQYEGYYASVVYTFFKGLGVETITEDATNHGHIDLTLLVEENIFILEFKVDRNNTTAIDQIKKKKYVEKYISSGKEVYIIGVTFSCDDRNITLFQWEKVES